MDTKLKNYRFSSWLKLFAVLLCVAGMLTLAYGLIKAPYFEVAVQNTDFKESMNLKNILFDNYSNISSIAFKYKNEEYIKSGAALNQDEINNRKSNLMNEKENFLVQIENNYENIYNDLQYNGQKDDVPDTNLGPDESISQSTTTTQEDTPSLDSEQDPDQIRIKDIKVRRNNDINQMNQKYDALIKNVETQYINEQLSDFNQLRESLNMISGIFYTVVENGKITLSNINGYNSTDTFYKELPFSIQLTANNAYTFFSPLYLSSQDFPNNAIVYLGMSEGKYNTELATFNQHSKEGLNGIKFSSIGLLAFLIGLIYIIYSSGRRVDKEGIQLLTLDEVYLDAALVVSVVAIVLCISQLSIFGRYLFTNKTYLNINLLYISFGIAISIVTLIGILFITMFSKRAKRHEVIKHTLIIKISAWIIRNIKSIYTNLFSEIKFIIDKSPLAKRLVLIFGAYAGITIICMLIIARGFFAGAIDGGNTVFFSFFSFIVMGLAGIVGVNFYAIKYLLKIFKTFKDIKNGADRIRAGELSYTIPDQGIPELRQLADTINKIADGLKTSVSNQVKAERMKSQLITNVSHDLKTPLTSIITYVDLLKSEGLKSENADKYLGIIDTKCQRLKSLTEDLFEAAKATSGNISVNTERLDVVSLISQGLGELSDKIEASGLSFKTNIQSEKLYVNADGKLLWRVIENLLSNVFKYAMPNSRVYIDATATTEHVSLIIKNISAYELNINEDELMERFKRGDASRHSEGSGLGLSIAKSLTELQGGSFHIEIDGDLFKATIVLPISR